jgi:hypothetical protein
MGVIELLAEGMTLADKSGVGSEPFYEFVKVCVHVTFLFAFLLIHGCLSFFV